MSKFDVALITTHVAPAQGYGGIAESVARLAHAWGRQNRRFCLCSSDASLGRPLQAADVGLPPQVPTLLYRAQWFRRWGFGLGAPWMILRCCLMSRRVFINGIGTWPTTLAGLICLVLRRPMVVAPHAGLMQEHVRIIRSEKPHKWAFYRLLTFPALRRARSLHVTSALEQRGLGELLPEVPSFIVANGVDLKAWPVQPSPPERPLTLCYVGRFSREKGILRFLEAWLDARRPGERLLLAGSGSGAYGETVKRLAAGAGDCVEHLGLVDHEGVRQALARSHFLVLPSGIEHGDLRENFGNAVAEALASGRPVLVTRGLAWDHCEAGGFGFCFGPSAPEMAAVLQRARSVDRVDWERMTEAARSHAEGALGIDSTAARIWDALQ